MDRQFVTIAVQQDGEARTETVMGREFRVFPAVLVREQVLHNNLGRMYLPGADITPEWADAANNAPVVLGHPKDGDDYVSARQPDVLNEVGVGYLFRTTADGAELKGEVFLDTSRQEAVPGLADILASLQDEEPTELSTGFPIFVEKVPGVFAGNEYDLIGHPAGFDHLAVFAGEEVGACSVDDGCGLGVNEEEEDAEDEMDGKKKKKKANPSRYQRSWLQQLVDTAQKLLGVQKDMSLDDRRMYVSDAVEAKWGGNNVWTYVADFYEDRAIVCIDPSGGERAYYSVDYTISDEGEVELGERIEVERVVEFVPVDNVWESRVTYAAPDAAPSGEDDMDRDQMIAKLADCESCPFGKATLEAMTPEELAGVANAAGLTESDPEPEPTQPQPTESDAVAVEALLQEIKGLKSTVQKLTEGVKPVFDEQQREHDSLVEALAENERVAFDKDELAAMPLATLHKLAQTAEVRVYAGRGGPMQPATNQDEEKGYAPVRNAWATKPMKDPAASSEGEE